MNIQRDSEGFLVGTPIDLTQATKYLRGIKSDVSAIKSALASGGTSFSMPSAAAAPRQRNYTPHALPERDASGRFISAASQAQEAQRVATPNRPSSAPNVIIQSLPNVEVATPIMRSRTADVLPERDASGRFTSSSRIAATPSTSDSGVRLNNGAINEIAGRVADVSSQAVSGLGDADPTVRAIQEISEPMRRGYETLFGGRETPESGWLKKLFEASKDFFKKQTVFNRAQQRTLEEINNDLEGQRADNFLSRNHEGGLLSRIPGVSALRRRFGSLGGLGLLLRAGSRKIPILGSLIAAFGAGSDVMDTESDPTLSRRQKDVLDGKSIGGFLGSIGGMVGGAALGSVGGPAGAFAGGTAGMLAGDQLGQMLGEKFGAWVDDLIKANIPEKIMAVWDKFAGIFTKFFDKTKTIGKVGLAIAKEQLNDSNRYIAATTGIDIKKDLNLAKGDLLNKAAQGKKWLSNKASQAGNWVKNKASQSVDFLEHDTSIGRGIGALNEIRKGGSRSWRNKNPGNLRFGDYAKRHGAIGADKGGFAIFPTLKEGREAQEKLLFEGKNYKNLNLSDAINRWAPPSENDTGTYQKRMLDAVSGKNVPMSQYSPAERQTILAAMQKHEGYIPGKVITQTASFTPPSIKAMPKPQAIPDMPVMVAQLGSNGSSEKPVIVNIPSQDVGQDLSDRRIAHLVTGGYSNRPY